MGHPFLGRQLANHENGDAVRHPVVVRGDKDVPERAVLGRFPGPEGWRLPPRPG